MRYLSVCSGIEAATVAWHGLGWEPVALAEIEAFPAAVLAQRYPSVPNLGDLMKYREWPEELLAQVDLLVGGTPCQAFSVAGKRQSLDDERGNLSLTYVNLFHRINEVRKSHGRSPAIAVWENVPGVLSTKDNAFGCFLSGLAGEDVPLQPPGGKWSNAGYVLGPERAVAWRVLDAQYFGVAQRRRRVFLVSGAGDGFSPAAVLFESESVRRDNPPSRAKGQRTSGPIAGCSNGGGANGPGRTADDADSLIPIGRGGDQANSEHCISHAGTLNCDKGQQGGIVAFTKSKRAQSATDDESWVPGEVAPTFNCFDQGDTRATTVVAIQERAICENPDAGPDGAGVRADGVSYTLEARQVPQAVAYDVHGTLAKKGASETDVHTALRSRSPGQSEASTTTVVAFTQNTREEVRQINGDGQIAGALSAEGGMHQTNYIAFAQNQLGEVRTNSEVMGTVNTNQNASGRNTPMVMQGVGVDFQNCATTADVCGTLMGEAQKKGGEAVHGVWTPMAVRRLTPRECERLQGFPDDYTAITYRNKPAADGPRYKALGNSMAVPCMAWIGHRIQKTTG